MNHRDPRDGYLPGLDGWRAIAILSVIAYHSAWGFPLGAYGVDVFFAISGLLITSKLVDEEKAMGRLSLRRFYVRRACRIFPAAMAYLLILAAFSLMGWVHVGRGEWLASLFFCRNYSFLYLGRDPWYPWFTTHFWSLSIEEHFYLVLPSLLLLTRGRVRVVTLASVSGLVIAHRGFTLLHRDWFTVASHTDMRFDALMVPALLAVLWRSDRYGVTVQKTLMQWQIVLVLCLAACLAWVPWGAWQATGLAVLLPCVVLGTVLQPQSLATRCLEWTPLRWVGRISYSLYLWQQLFFVERFYLWRPLGRLQARPLNLCLTFLAAIASYYCLERPWIRVGHRLTARKPRGVMHEVTV